MKPSEILGVSALAALAVLHQSHAALSRGTCKSKHRATVLEEASDDLDQVSKLLLKRRVFDGYVDGLALLAVDNNTGVILGGATNPNGYYFSYLFEADALPESACDKLTPGPFQSALATICQPTSHAELTGDVTNYFFLGPSDAIVFRGCTPPPVHYFGFDMYINARLEEDFIFYPGTNFGDTLSIRDVNVSSDEAMDGLALYDQPVAIVQTADGASARAISQAFNDIGVSPDSVNTHALNADVLRTYNRSQEWEESRPDLLFNLQRVTEPFPGHGAAFELYKTLAFPVRLFVGPAGQDAAEPLNPDVASRETDDIDDDAVAALPTEVDLLNASLSSLMSSVHSTYKSLGADFMAVSTSTLVAKGYYDDWNDVLADQSNDTYVIPTRDAGYASPEALVPAQGITNRTFVVLLGVEHTLNGTRNRAGFSSAGLDIALQSPCNGTNCLAFKIKFTEWLSHRDLRDSATRYSPRDPLARHLYAIDFVPPGYCSKPPFLSRFCREFDKTTFDELSDYPLFPMVAERIYSVAATGVGASAEESLLVRGLVFNLPDDM